MRLLTFCLLTLLLVANSAAQAADCDVNAHPDAGRGPGVVLHMLMQPDCVGDFTNDQNVLTQALLKDDLKLKSRDKPKGGPLETLTGGAQLALERLGKHAQSQAQAASGDLASQWRAVASELARSSEKARALNNINLWQLAIEADEVISKPLRFYRGESETAAEIDGARVQPICSTIADATTCDQFDSRVSMWRVIVLAKAVHYYLQTPANDIRVRDYQIKLARWDAYRSQALHQTWWELGINSWRMNSDDKICPRDSEGQRQGFCTVPSDQLIVLHPDVGLRYSRNANNSNELKPYLVLELLGRFSYSWKALDVDLNASIKDIATIDNSWGYSLAAAYGYDSDRNRWALGPMLHRNGFNLGFTRSTSGRWALMLNTTLSDRIFKLEQDWTSRLQNAGLSGP